MTASACACELGRARCHLERAIAELELARLAWGAWADGVRRLAEQRTGISVADGFALLDDPDYAQALRLGRVVRGRGRRGRVGAGGGGRRRRRMVHSLPACAGG